MQRGELMEKILDALQDGIEMTGDILSVFFAGYGESYRRARRLTMGLPIKERSSGRWSEEYRRLQSFYNLLNILKREGFIAQKSKGRKGKSGVWRITDRGVVKLKTLKHRKMFSPKCAEIYTKQEDGKVRVVVFDVPEKERHKRVWLRASLIALGFHMCQKSVWLGKCKIPEQFLKDLRERELLDKVHIFEITRTGSLKEILQR